MLCQMHTYWFSRCQRSCKFPLWWTLSVSSVSWDINHSWIYNGMCIRQHRKSTSALHFMTIALPSHRALLFTHGEFYGCWRAADVAFQRHISKDDCMLETDAACLGVNSLIQETTYVSSTIKASWAAYLRWGMGLWGAPVLSLRHLHQPSRLEQLIALLLPEVQTDHQEGENVILNWLWMHCPCWCPKACVSTSSIADLLKINKLK